MYITFCWDHAWTDEGLNIRIDVNQMVHTDRIMLEETINYLEMLVRIHGEMDYHYSSPNLVYSAIRSAMDTIMRLVVNYEDYEELGSLLTSENHEHHSFNFSTLVVCIVASRGSELLELDIRPPPIQVPEGPNHFAKAA
jgi:hypothetical protein